MSDANLATLAYQEEPALGVNPTPALKELRYTKETLRFEKETVSSAEVRSDRQKPDMQKVFGQPTGGFEFELSYLFILPFLAAAMHADWITIDLTVDAALDAGDSTAIGDPGSFDTVPIGCILVIGGANAGVNAGPKRVINKSPDGSTLTFATGAIVADAAEASLDFNGNTISNGVTRKSTMFEKRIVNADGEDYYQRYRGLVLDTLELRIESKRLVTGTMGFVGTTYDLGNDSADPDSIMGASATGTLTFTGQPTDGQWINIGGVVYTFKTVPTAAYQVDIGADASGSLDNLIAAINAGAGSGTAYGAGTIACPLVTAAAGVGDTMVVTAIRPGALGNTIRVTDGMEANAAWGSATLTGGATQAAGYGAADDGDVMNGTNNMGLIRMDGQTAQDRFKALTLSIANGVRGKDALGFEGNWDVGLGQFAVTGNMNAYFRNNNLPTKIKEHTSFSLDIYVQDAAGNRIYFYLPAVKPASGDPTIQGINTDVMIETAIEAIKGSNAGNPTGKTLICDAIAAGSY